MTNAISRLAQHLSTLPTTEPQAARLIFRVLHHRRCPRCHARSARPHHRHIHCRRCHRTSSLTANTPLANTKLPLLLWLHAIHSIHVDTRTPTARGFARQHQLRPMTAWSLLHRVRGALPSPRPTDGPALQLLGNSGGPSAWVRAQANPIAFDVTTTMPRRTTNQPLASLLLGQLRCWIVEVFKGVSPDHLQRYVDEFAYRYGRVGAVR